MGAKRLRFSSLAVVLGALLVVGLVQPVTATAAPGDESLTTVTGLVTDRGGAPVREATVSLYQRDEEGEFRLVSGPLQTARDGSYAFPVAPTGAEMTVAAEIDDPDGQLRRDFLGDTATSLDDAEGFTPPEDSVGAEFPVDEHLVLDVDRTDIAGRVTNTAGDPVASAYVRLYRKVSGAWVEQAAASTADDGTYRFSDRRLTGTYTVSAQGSDDHSSSTAFLEDIESIAEAQGLTIPATASGGTFEPADLVLDLNRIALTGVVETLEGEPVASSLVRLYRLIDGTWSERNSQYTDADGRYRFANEKRTGTWKISAEGYDDYSDQFAESAPIELDPIPRQGTMLLDFAGTSPDGNVLSRAHQ